MVTKEPLDLHDLLTLQGIDPDAALLMRHTAETPELSRQLPWIAAERPESFTAFQSFHKEYVARMVRTKELIVSTVADTGGALFVGLFRTGAERTLTQAEWEALPGNAFLHSLGAEGPDESNAPTVWFDMQPDERLAGWTGRLLLSWPGGRGYTRMVRPGLFGVLAVHEENQLTAAPPDPASLVVTFEELQTIPRSWWARLSQWRGIYYIRHRSSGRGYVGSAYGTENIAQRWRIYAETGHGHNRDLRGLDPTEFVFSVLELVAPTADPADVIRLEQSWKVRLSTRAPHGLNAN